MLKTKTITLTTHPNVSGPGHAYRVVKITDSSEYLPDSVISQSIVDILTAAPRWKVTIISKKAA